VAACAVHRQTGDWPRSVTFFDLPTGAAVRADGDALPFEQALAEVAAAVSGLRRQSLPA
jgi:hypothetical protein